MTEKLINRELEILASGGWGTINPHSVSAAAALAGYVGAEYGLLCHSADSAYEALLRQFGAAHGDAIVAGEISLPSDSLVALITGAKTIFAPVCERCGMIRPKGLAEILTENKNVKCVVLDIVPETLEEYKLDKIFAITREYGVGLILNAGGAFSAKWNGTPLVKLCDAVLYSCEEGSEIFCVKGGFIATDAEPVYSGAFAYHNCGRSFGEGCSLDIDGIVGGDFRVTEFTAVIAEEILESGHFSAFVPGKREKMADQPVFSSDYAIKMTGN
ncbi:MAG: DegT/DnrJ/EryC1/StrS family aminotransferase [Lachnospiraceae bacterium]|nr:DegT/DnrJ/EryC1/StrS family aminotransferase [Lachnospiraceae bacterium]